MYNLELYRKKYLMLEIFAKFLGEEYDTDDLQFFLYARNVTQHELTKKSLQPKTAIANRMVCSRTFIRVVLKVFRQIV